MRSLLVRYGLAVTSIVLVGALEVLVVRAPMTGSWLGESCATIRSSTT